MKAEAAQTLNDVLSKTQKFHNQMADTLAGAAANCSGERATMLINYLIEQEKKLASTTEAIQDAASPEELNIWFYEFAQKHNVTRAEPSHKPFAGMTTTEILGEVMEQHQQIIQLYRYLYSRATTSHARELLGNLVQMEQREAMVLAREGNRVEEI